MIQDDCIAAGEMYASREEVSLRDTWNQGVEDQ